MFPQQMLSRTFQMFQVAQKRAACAMCTISCRKPNRCEPRTNAFANEFSRSFTSKTSEQIKQEKPQEITPMHSLREFFMHPLTWDRNNGYLNILLGLAIFGFCFCSSCSSENSKRTNLRETPKKA